MLGIKYKTWAEESIAQCHHFEINEVICVYFKFWFWTIRIDKKFFPRKFYTYWKVYDNTPK